MNNLGKQFILDLKDCNKDVLDDLEFLKETLSAIVQQTHETLIGESFYQFTPQGVSGLVLGNGAHVCIHTWPEHSYAAMDIFTHNESFDLKVASKLIIEKLGSRNPSITELERGA
ncbi:MAG: adenosylmethionine decarboxylase [Chloroflexota bacterium]|nr:adenosylmethionine decarboxylase [Chloroflexota bacterium]